MTTAWTAVAAETDLFEGAGIGVQVQGRSIVLFIEGHEVECPFHQGRFDVRTGAPTCAPVTEAIKTYPIKIDGGQVWLQL